MTEREEVTRPRCARHPNVEAARLSSDGTALCAACGLESERQRRALEVALGDLGPLPPAPPPHSSVPTEELERYRRVEEALRVYVQTLIESLSTADVMPTLIESLSTADVMPEEPLESSLLVDRLADVCHAMGEVALERRLRLHAAAMRGEG